MKFVAVFLATVATVLTTSNADPTSSVALPVLPSPTGVQAKTPPSTSCDNVGLEYAYYTENYDFEAQEDYDNYDPTPLKQLTPNVTGVTIYSQYDAMDPYHTDYQAPYPVSNNETFPSTFFALDHRGYIYANYTGLYTFTIGFIDDIHLLWLGQKAYSGWTRANADSIVAYNLTLYEGSEAQFQVPLTNGYYYAIRALFAQGGGDATTYLQIADPTGLMLLGDHGTWDGTRNVFTFSCDDSAPPFPAFGNE